MPKTGKSNGTGSFIAMPDNKYTWQIDTSTITINSKRTYSSRSNARTSMVKFARRFKIDLVRTNTFDRRF